MQLFENLLWNARYNIPEIHSLRWSLNWTAMYTTPKKLSPEEWNWSRSYRINCSSKINKKNLQIKWMQLPFPEHIKKCSDSKGNHNWWRWWIFFYCEFLMKFFYYIMCRHIINARSPRVEFQWLFSFLDILLGWKIN